MKIFIFLICFNMFKWVFTSNNKIFKINMNQSFMNNTKNIFVTLVIRIYPYIFIFIEFLRENFAILEVVSLSKKISDEFISFIFKVLWAAVDLIASSHSLLLTKVSHNWQQFFLINMIIQMKENQLVFFPLRDFHSP